MFVTRRCKRNHAALKSVQMLFAVKDNEIER